jgi:fructuronate reductase
MSSHEGVEAVLPRLSFAQLPFVPAEYRPEIDPRDRLVRIVHLGIGAFHRAHQAYYTERSGDWGICGVTQRSRSVAEQLLPQDGLYTLVERSSDTTSLRVIGAVRDVMCAADVPDDVVRRIADPRIEVVTATVTEKGYRYDADTGDLRLDDPDIAADLTGRTPRTVVGQLAAAISARAMAGGPPLTIVCCDNLPANGSLLGRLVHTFFERGARGAVAGEWASAAQWMADHVTFPSTMVDRIVPATTAEDRQFVASALGVEDRGTVVAEPFTQWVIENRFAGGRPAWEVAGALLVEDVAPYEQLKLRVLNGTHSALAYLGGLAGYETIAAAITDDALARFAQALIRDDVVPTLAVPAGVDVVDYQARVLERFANRALNHRTAQIAMDGSHKLPQRLLGTIRDRRAAGGEPVFATLGVAAWMRHVVAGRTDDGRPFAPDDPLLGELREAVREASSAEEVVAGLLGVREIFGDLADDAWLRGRLTSFVDELSRHGVLEVVKGLTR